MARMVGTVARGLRAPIIREGDDLVKIAADVLVQAAETECFDIHDNDILALTESIVARMQGNYASCDAIAVDVRNKFPAGECGLIFPILSRNRFAVILRGLARGLDKIYLQLSYPADEVGNHLFSYEDMDQAKINPYLDVLTEKRYRELFGNKKHQFTGMDYVAYYRQIIENEGASCEIIFANNPQAILDYTPYVLSADIHTRFRNKQILRTLGAKSVYGLDDILSSAIGDSGYNADYGLLGSNKVDEERIKLFPRDCEQLAKDIQAEIYSRTNKLVQVMVYGDGAFKDPVGKIWELADPVVSPGFTSGLNGQPNELKLKYLADNNFATLEGSELNEAIKQAIREKEANLVGKMETQGTTPRRLTDLIGSLCDLVTGSGDKGTPIVLVQGYFDNYAIDND